MLRIALLGVIALLYLASVPWYRESGASTPLWLGLPEWVSVAVVCYAGAAVLNAVAWLLTDIPETEEDLESQAAARFEGDSPAGLEADSAAGSRGDDSGGSQ
jgi:hypothetical protein